MDTFNVALQTVLSQQANRFTYSLYRQDLNDSERNYSGIEQELQEKYFILNAVGYKVNHKLI